MIEATRKVTFRDFLIFQLKLVMDGAKDLAIFPLSIGAMLLDVLAGGGKRPRAFYSVLRLSERFDLWLNLHGAVEQLAAGDLGDDGLFGASEAGSDHLLGQLERLVRGRDAPPGSSERAEGPAGPSDRTPREQDDPRDG